MPIVNQVNRMGLLPNRHKMGQRNFIDPSIFALQRFAVKGTVI